MREKTVEGSKALPRARPAAERKNSLRPAEIWLEMRHALVIALDMALDLRLDLMLDRALVMASRTFRQANSSPSKRTGGFPRVVFRDR
jgi:hypothetical protein